jgi:hypothetical protein
MLVRFEMDYRGRLTAERFYKTGEVVEFPDEIANQLVRDRRAVTVGGDSSPGQGNDTLADETAASHLTYRELQALAKKSGIPANQSRDDLIEALR